MEVQIESLSPVEKKLTIRVPAERVQKELDDAYRTLQRDVALPGFRKGKVPRKFLEGRYGQHVNGEVGTKLITESFEKAAEDNKVVPVSQPTIERGQVRAGEPYEFAVRVEVRPEVVVEGYAGMDLPFERVEVTPAEILGEVEALRKQSGTTSLVEEERPVAEGDLVEVDFTFRAEGVADFSQKTYPLGVEDSMHGFLYPLVMGLSVGEERSADVEIPPAYYQKRWAGKTAQVTLSVKAIKAVSYPEIGDALAVANGFENLDALEGDIRFRLTESKEKAARAKAFDTLSRLLVEKYPVDVPPGLQRAQAEQMIRNTTAQLQAQGVKVRNNLRLDDLDGENRGRVLEEAAFAIRRALLLESIADAEKIEVQEEDVDEKIREMAEQYRQRPEAVRGMLVKNQALDDMKARIREDKALDFLLEQANIVDQVPEDGASADAPGSGEARETVA